MIRSSQPKVKAAIYRRYGPPDVLRIEEVAKPHSETVKIHISGMKFAGQVEGKGNGVTRFAEGDEVFGLTGFKFGTHAEYVVRAREWPTGP